MTTAAPPERRSAPLLGLGEAAGLTPVGVDEPEAEPDGAADPDAGEAPLAVARKASKVLSAVGLTANTMPLLQCVPVKESQY